MIISFRHKGLEKFFRTGSKAGIGAAQAQAQAQRLRLILGGLDRATNADDVMALHGLRAHQLIGKDKGFIPVWVNRNWRITFRFTGADVELVDYRDYH